MGLRHFAAGLSLVRFVPTHGSRQNGPLAFRRLALARALVGPARRWLRRRCLPPASGFSRFRHVWVSGNAHKPLNVQEETDHG